MTLKDLALEQWYPQGDLMDGPDELAYRVLQAGGLLYGFPVNNPFTDRKNPPELDKLAPAKQIFLDVLLFTGTQYACFYRGLSPLEAQQQCGEWIRQYYIYLAREHYGLEIAAIEEVLSRRVLFQKHLLDFRRSGINAHLFWDVYCLLKWIASGQTDFDQIPEEKQRLKKTTLLLAAAMVHSDDRIHKREKKLLQYFRHHTHFLSPEDQKEITRFFKFGISLDQVPIPPIDWLGRRYLLDMALLIALIDADLENGELAAIRDLAEQLEIPEAIQFQSKAGAGIFLYQYGAQLHVLANKRQGIQVLAAAMADNFKSLAYATKMEYVETVDMARIFGKALKYHLQMGEEPQMPSEVEIRAAFDQLKDIPKFLPFFSVMFLPVPGITELYILMAYSVERFTGNSVRLLPSQFSEVVKKKSKSKKGQDTPSVQ